MKNGWQRLLPAVSDLKPTIIACYLAVPAAVRAPTTVETTAAAHGRSASETAAREATAPNRAASHDAAPANESTAADKASSTVEPATPIESTAAVEPAAKAAAEPGTRPDEDTTGEPIRAVVAVGRASIWGIAVIAIRADRSAVTVAVASVNRTAYSDAHRDSLSISE
jgi:hypothetical protein